MPALPAFRLEWTGAAKLDRALLPVAALLLVLCFVTVTRADPDLWGHVRFGEDMIDAQTVRVADTYSFTSDRPWVNHEWLAEIVMAAAYRGGGATGLVLVKLLVIALSVTCIWHIVRSHGGSRRAAAILTAIALAGILPRTQMVRPQLFSVLWFAVLLLLLRRAEQRPLFLWVCPAIFAIWANMHGGWLVGASTLLAWCAVRTLTIATPRRDEVFAWTACGLSVAATLLTPYGLDLWIFLRETVGTSRRFIAEWGPVTGAWNLLIAWAGFWFLIAVAVRRAPGGGVLRLALLPMFWGIVSFKVSRLDAFFALSTIAFLAPALLKLFERRAAGHAAHPSLVVRTVVSVIGLLTCAIAAPQLTRNLSCIDVHASTMPEPAAVAFMRDRQLSGRMVTYFDWGQYIIWHKPDGLRVSMDGRRETVYSDSSIDTHLDMYLGTEQGSAYLRALKPDYVWVPNQLPLATDLSESRAWKATYRGALSTIFARSDAAATTLVQDGTTVGCRCFPGP